MFLMTALLLAGAVEAPLSLTASDGSGLRLVSLDADAVCGGPVCFTELRLSFENPQDRVIEGQFQIALPPGASVSRFAMKIDGRLQEAEVVEKKAARRAYEDFLHRRQDPALLEQAAGNQFQARVFPIPAKGVKELVIGYGHTLTSSSSAYVFPLAGLPQVENLKVRVRDGEGKALLTLEKQKFVPSSDASVDVKGAKAVRSEDVVVVRAAPVFESAADVGDGGVVLLVDTSASRALQMPKDVALVTALLQEMAKTSPTRPLVVTAFDQDVEEVYRGTVGGFDPARLSKRRALGATDLGGALRQAMKTIDTKAFDRIVVVTDGVDTAELSGSLTDTIGVMKGRVRRVDAIVRGGVRDEVALRPLVRAGKQEGLVVDGDAPVSELARRLGRVARSGISVDVVGATWVWPKFLDGMQPGDERVIVAELKPGTRLVVKLGGVAVDVGAEVAAPKPLLRRAWAEAKIARAQEQLTTTSKILAAEARKEIKEQIVTLSTKHRVLSSETSLLILETEADYVRYGIDRKSLADILVVTDAGLGLISRKDVVVAAPVVVAPKKPKASDAKKKSSMRRAEGESESPRGQAEEGEREEDSDGTGDKEREKDSAPEAKSVEDSDDVVEEASKTEARDERPSPAPRAPSAEPSMPSPSPPPPPSEARNFNGGGRSSEPEQTFVNPWTGPFDEGMKLLKAGKRDEALRKARAWHEEQPGDVLALLLMAEILEGSDVDEAARALGSIIDLFPQRTDLRRAVGARLDRLLGSNPKVGKPVISALSVDTWRQSVEQRPDHPQSHRGLAWALVRKGDYAGAFAAIENALQQKVRTDGFRGVDRILREDLGLIGAVWQKHGGPKDIAQRVKKAGGVVAGGPSLRFVLWWETDSNDVDFHIRDGKGNHAFYSQPTLPTGGELYADVTTGYGPECFTVPGGGRTFPYALSAHYYSRGPMGFGLGSMMVIDHDGKGGVTFSDRTFVIMVDGAFVDLGSVTK
ncbi:MAG: VIT domain-containing protein [Deltaproteobacteria bacterium]|nr:VIT domain-containing protein [Deltaproteobacteria bacterium]